jgi:hypothetical protein
MRSVPRRSCAARRDVVLTGGSGLSETDGVTASRTPAEILAELQGGADRAPEPEPPKVPTPRPTTLATAPPSGQLEAIPLSEVRMRSIEWLEKPLWQRSAFQLLAGPKGSGKGTYLAGLAARVSRTGNVLFVSSEDSVAIDLKPRLVAAGAVIERCFHIPRHVNLPHDVEGLRELAEGLGGVEMFVIDPVANHIGDSNSNSEAEVRNAIAQQARR